MLLLRAKFLGFPAVDNGETHQSSLQIDSFEDNCCYCKGIRTFFSIKPMKMAICHSLGNLRVIEVYLRSLFFCI